MEIQTDKTNLERFFTGLSTCYSVPNYQRDYSWTFDEISQLWEDLLAAYKNQSDYFVGTLVLNKEKDNGRHEEGQYDIVDGQQRLATISIFFCVIRNISTALVQDRNFQGHIERSNDLVQLATKISNYAEDRLLYRSEPDNYYLKLNAKDGDIFFRNVQKYSPPALDNDSLRLIKSENRLIKAKKIITKLMRDEFLQEPGGIQKLYEFLFFLCKKLQFIKIVVATDYDAYLLFESLNSKGLDLSTADLVKNKLLSICRHDEAKRNRVLSIWNEIVSKLSESRFQNPVDFLRFYWIAFSGERPTKRDLYAVMRAELQKPNFNVELFMSDLFESVERFVSLTNANRVWPSSEIESDSMEQYFSEMNVLRYSIHIPTFLVAMKTRSDLFVTKLSKKSTSFLFRLMSIGDFSVSTADTVFSVATERLRQNKPDDEILECFKTEPDKISDSAFRGNFRNFVSEDNQLCRYILAKIHIHQVGYEQIPKADEIHLEHVLPQNSSLWEEAGFQCGEKKIDELKFSIGNMTLLNKSLNSSISNRIFSEKVTSYKRRDAAGQVGTTFPMTYLIHQRFVDTGEAWSQDIIERRADAWANLAVDIWPL